MLIRYHWLHIPTGISGVSTQEFVSKWDAYEKVNSWQAMGERQYRIDSHDMYVGP